MNAAPVMMAILADRHAIGKRSERVDEEDEQEHVEQQKRQPCLRRDEIEICAAAKKVDGSRRGR
jgi:hypothetical protein